MTPHCIAHALVWVQSAAGGVILLAGLALLAAGTDGHTKRLQRWPLVGLPVWGAWFALQPWMAGGPDSLAAVAFALLVAYVLVRYGRQVRGIVDGEDWWPPNARRLLVPEVLVSPRRTVPTLRKLNPLWALFGNEDDGYYGDRTWNPEGRADVRTGVRWWLRNPAHNLTFYVVGVADRERIVRGPWAPSMHRPGGGWLWCCTHVQVGPVRLCLPFLSYLGPRLKGYAGWRPGSGALGIKFNVLRPAAAEAPEVHP